MMDSSIRPARHLPRAAAVATIAIAAGVFLSSSVGASRTALPASLFQAGQAPQAADDARRMVIVLDLVSLSGDELTRAVSEVESFVARGDSEPRLIAIATVRPALRVVSDFTADRAALRAILQSPDLLSTRASSLTAPADATPAGTDERLVSIARLCEVMAPIAQRKGVLYFSSGSSGLRADNLAELRSVTTSCTRANVSVYGVDARGLAVINGNGGAVFGR